MSHKQPMQITSDEVLLNQLREILLSRDREEFEELKSTVNTPEKLREKVDPFIDEKISFLKKNFPEEFGKLVETAIEEKLEDSKEQLLNVIYPVVGLMIRKYVSYQFQLLKDKIDQQVNAAFSFKGFLGRVKSKVFGIKSSDLVLSEIDVPIVEEMYVIQIESGLLIGSYSRNDATDQDMIAGMLTAIKSFGEDAFKREKEKLELIEYGSYKLMIQNFYKYYIAVALSGSLSSMEKDQLSNKLLEFAQNEMDVSLSVVNSSLTAKVSEKLMNHFQENIFEDHK